MKSVSPVTVPLSIGLTMKLLILETWSLWMLSNLLLMRTLWFSISIYLSMTAVEPNCASGRLKACCNVLLICDLWSIFYGLYDVLKFVVCCQAYMLHIYYCNVFSLEPGLSVACLVTSKLVWQTNLFVIKQLVLIRVLYIRFRYYFFNILWEDFGAATWYLGNCFFFRIFFHWK